MKKRNGGNFVDYMRIRVRGGAGGDGGISFEFDGMSPRGRPSGGDGGAGGCVIVQSDASFASLNHLSKFAKGDRGGNGGRNMQKGAIGKNHIIKVPVGSEIREYIIEEAIEEEWSHDNDEVDDNPDCTEFTLVDTPNMEGRMPLGVYKLEPEDAEQMPLRETILSTINDPPMVVARGGRGGRGNYGYGNNNHDYEKGQRGEERIIEIDLKTIADVGLVGLPNAGKSSFLNAISNAHPQIASYPFTTLSPYVGIIEYPKDEERISVADIPGLIEGAHENRGLGHEFLKHVVKSRILALVVDFSKEDPWRDIQILRNELDLFQDGLSRKCRLVIANKADLLDGETLIRRISDTKNRANLNAHPTPDILPTTDTPLPTTDTPLSTIDILPISALHNLAITKVIDRLLQLVRAERNKS